VVGLRLEDDLVHSTFNKVMLHTPHDMAALNLLTKYMAPYKL